MMTTEEVCRYLEENQVAYTLMEKDTTPYDPRNPDQYYVKLKSATTWVVESEQGPVALLLSAECAKLPLEVLGSLTGLEEVHDLSPTRVQEALGCAPEEVPLVGNGLPCFFDQRLLQYDCIYGGSGDPLKQLKLAPMDVLKLNHVVGYLM